MAELFLNNALRIASLSLNYVSPSVIADVILHPFDFATVLLQLGYDPKGMRAGPATFVSVLVQYAVFSFYIPYLLTSVHGVQFMGVPHPSIFYYVSYIYRKEGFIGCYRGLIPKICERLVMVHTNESVKQMVSKGRTDPTSPSVRFQDHEQEHLTKTIVNNICSHFFAVVASHPFHVIMVNSFAEFTNKKKSSIPQLAKKIYSSDGYYGFFVGLAPRLVGELLSLIFSVIYTAVINKQRRQRNEDQSLQLRAEGNTVVNAEPTAQMGQTVVSNDNELNNESDGRMNYGTDFRKAPSKPKSDTNKEEESADTGSDNIDFDQYDAHRFDSVVQLRDDVVNVHHVADLTSSHDAFRSAEQTSGHELEHGQEPASGKPKSRKDDATSEHQSNENLENLASEESKGEAYKLYHRKLEIGMTPKPAVEEESENKKNEAEATLKGQLKEEPVTETTKDFTTEESNLLDTFIYESDSKGSSNFLDKIKELATKTSNSSQKGNLSIKDSNFSDSDIGLSIKTSDTSRQSGKKEDLRKDSEETKLQFLTEAVKGLAKKDAPNISIPKGLMKNTPNLDVRNTANRMVENMDSRTEDSSGFTNFFGRARFTNTEPLGEVQDDDPFFLRMPAVRSLLSYVPLNTRHFYFMMVRDYLSKKISYPFFLVCHCMIVLDTGWEKLPAFAYVEPWVKFIHIFAPRRKADDPAK